MSVPRPAVPRAVPGRRLPPVQPAQASPPPKLPDVSDEPFPFFEPSYWVELWRDLKAKAGPSLLVSISIHLVILLFLAIPVIRAFQEELPTTTIVTAADIPDELGIIGDSLSDGLDLTSMEPAPSEDSTPQALIPLQSDPLESIDLNPEDIPGLASSKTSNSGAGTGPKKSTLKKGNGGSGTSGRTDVPKNAVVAGNFSVWSWPILGKDLQGGFRHAEAGASPNINQDYHIVIRFKVPDDRAFIDLSDLSGEILGTDHYMQKIPYDAWYFNPAGKLVQAKPKGKVPVIDGTVEVLIRVPGASSARVRDTITVSSQVIKEEQKIELVFLAPGSTLSDTKPEPTEPAP